MPRARFISPANHWSGGTHHHDENQGSHANKEKGTRGRSLQIAEAFVLALVTLTAVTPT